MIYRPSLIYIVPDALSRLKGNTVTPVKIPNAENLNPYAYAIVYDLSAYAFYIILVELSPDFKERLLRAYDDDEY